MGAISSSIDPRPAPVAPVPAPDWRDVRGWARVLDIGQKSLYAAVDRGDLKAAVINARGDLRISRQWIDEWLASRVGQTVAPVHPKRAPRAQREAQKNAGRRK